MSCDLACKGCGACEAESARKAAEHEADKAWYYGRAGKAEAKKGDQGRLFG